ncbi:hypothetical protein F4779DRAFT_584245, partial [Xylariaceae sp. FL0662B]
MLYPRSLPRTDDNAILTPPLQRGTAIKLSEGVRMPASRIIGRLVEDLVEGYDRIIYEIRRPTLTSYLVKTPRRLHKTTPPHSIGERSRVTYINHITPNDARLMVSLLDLHLEHPEERKNRSTIEILESSNSYGALLLCLLQAIHLANPPKKRYLTEAFLTSLHKYSRSSNGSMRTSFTMKGRHAAEYNDYLNSRSVVVNSVDFNLESLNTTIRNVRNFERARYILDVDFQYADMREFLRKRLEESNGEPSLHYALLDIEEPHLLFPEIDKAMHPGGLVVLHSASPEEISRFIISSMNHRSNLSHERTIQTPSINVPAGGNSWKINFMYGSDPTISTTASQDGFARTSNLPVRLPKSIARMEPGLPTSGGRYVSLFRKTRPTNVVSRYDGPQGEDRLVTWAEEDIIAPEYEPLDASELGAEPDTATSAPRSSSVQDFGIEREAIDELIQKYLSADTASVLAEFERAIENLEPSRPRSINHTPSYTVNLPTEPSGPATSPNDLLQEPSVKAIPETAEPVNGGIVVQRKEDEGPEDAEKKSQATDQPSSLEQPPSDTRSAAQHKVDERREDGEKKSQAADKPSIPKQPSDKTRRADKPAKDDDDDGWGKWWL